MKYYFHYLEKKIIISRIKHLLYTALREQRDWALVSPELEAFYRYEIENSTVALLGGLYNKLKKINFYEFASQPKVCTTYIFKQASILAQSSQEHVSNCRFRVSSQVSTASANSSATNKRLLDCHTDINQLTQTRRRADRLRELLRL